MHDKSTRAFKPRPRDSSSGTGSDHGVRGCTGVCLPAPGTCFAAPQPTAGQNGPAPPPLAPPPPTTVPWRDAPDEPHARGADRFYTTTQRCRATPRARAPRPRAPPRTPPAHPTMRLDDACRKTRTVTFTCGSGSSPQCPYRGRGVGVLVTEIHVQEKKPYKCPQ